MCLFRGVALFWILTTPLLGQAEAIWLDVPFVKQQKNGCGASSLAMVMEYWKKTPQNPDRIFSLLYSEKEKGIPASLLQRHLEENGFRTWVFRGDLQELQKHLSKGRPLIVCLRRDNALHYVVVVGIDRHDRLLLLNDPATRKLSKIEEQEFLNAWHPTDNWTLLAVPENDD